MKIRALKALTVRDESGALTSIAHGGIAEVSSDLGNSLITDGLAEAYTLISPTGSVSITANGTVDVTQYAQAAVNIADFKNLVDRSITTVTEDMLKGLTMIGAGAFAHCSSLTSVTIPSGVKGIAESAFYDCSSLASIEIPNGLTSIGEGVFRYCLSLESLTVKATTPPSLGDDALFNTNSSMVIYVPAESVETYKAASVWSTYASKIQAIPEE